MKKFKISILCLLAVVIFTVSLTAVRANGAKSDVFKAQTDYITAENLALSKASDKFKKLTDGDYSSCCNLFRKGGVQIDLDLESAQDFNCIVLKEKGLNIKSFTVLASADGETFAEIYEGDKIEYHRLCTFDTVNARYIRIFINDADQAFALREIEVYNQQPVDRSDFRTTAYILNSDFYTVMDDEAIPEDEKRDAVIEMLRNYHFSGLTHVNFYCGVSFDENGNVLLNGLQNDEKSEKDLAFMMDCMRELGGEDLKIVYTIGLSTGSPQTEPAMTENKDVFIDNLISFANTFGFDGIDFDYEFPQSDYEYQIFGDLLVELKERMNSEMNVGENNILSCAFGTRDIDYPKEVVEAIDIVNMMTYDIFDQDGQHSSFWSCAVQGVAYLESVGFTRDQINIGIPFYGTQTDALMEQYIYKDIQNYGYFDNTYTFNSYFNGEPTQVYFNSAALVRDKTAYAVLSDCGGIMAWHFSCDTDYASEYALWRAVYDAEDQFGGAQQ